jgi:hypothetical protein
MRLAIVSLAWHDFYFAPGVHIGKYETLTGGFAVGDVTNGLSKGHTASGYHGGFGFSLSCN